MFQNAALSIYRASYETANVLRVGVAERRDAYKWVAALSTAAFFFVAQALPRTGTISFSEARWLLLAELAFGLSVLGAAGYVLVVDHRVARWSREIYRHSVRVTTTLGSMDANAAAMREALDGHDIARANAAFKDTYRDKESLGKLLRDVRPRDLRRGRVGWLAERSCIGGLLGGVVLVGIDLVTRVAL